LAIGSQGVDLGGHHEIVAMKIADGVRPERNRYLAPLQENRRMMALGFGECADCIRKRQRLREIGEIKGAFQSGNVLAPDQGPLGDLRFQFLDLNFSDSRRIAAAGGASFVGKHGAQLFHPIICIIARIVCCRTEPVR
jgi:hypothetical protein